MPNEVRGRLEDAIDRAVRGIMQVDPRPGLRHRVADRLTAPARRAWLVPAYAAAVLAAVIASIVMLRLPEPASSTAPQIVAAPPAAAPHQAAAATPQPGEQPIDMPPVAASTPGTPKVRQPTPTAPSVGDASIFGPPSQRVTAASLRPEPLPAPAAPVDAAPMPDTLAPIAPIVIEPIVITPITVTPLIVRTPDRR